MHLLIDKKNKIIIYLFLLLILSTTNGKFVESQKSYFSKINQINIDGLSDNDKEKVFNELHSLLKKNIILVRKDEIKKVLSNFNIIEEYNIKKIYPSTININIKPTRFIARLSNNDQSLVGANGKLIKNKKSSKLLPYIFGEYNSKKFLFFKKNIDQSEFSFTELKTLYFFPSNRWDILTNDDTLIKLPEDNFLESLNLAHKIINKIDFKNKKIVDLRVKNHLVVK
jgi:cell division protein FtsQ